MTRPGPTWRRTGTRSSRTRDCLHAHERGTKLQVRLKADTTDDGRPEGLRYIRSGRRNPAILPSCNTAILPCTIAPMARYTLVYGVRLVPEGSLKDFTDATLKLADGSTAGVTLHTIDGTIPQLRRAMDRSLDAFFELL